MKNTRQSPLQDCLFGMKRVLPTAAAAAMAFSLVFFTPLVDMKDSIAAAAQSSGNNGNGGGKGNSGNHGNGGDRGNNGGGNSGNNGGGNNGNGNSNGSGNGRGPGSAASNASTNSGGDTSQTPTAGGILNRLFGQPGFNVDSEPSGGTLSEREEREAIQNGWQ
ncbi:hypothetical protein [Roseibium sp.]